MPKGPQKLPAARRIEIAAFPDMTAPGSVYNRQTLGDANWAVSLP
jgi:hypothetical protein